MNRVIKFRAWDKTRTANCSYDTYTLQELLQGRCYMPSNYENWEQFTGLHDKNGKEIYEGDLLGESTGEVMFCGKHKEAHSTYKNIVPVEWKEYKSSVGQGSGSTTINLIGWSPFNFATKETKYEVIGNIYENPELLLDETK